MLINGFHRAPRFGSGILDQLKTESQQAAEKRKANEQLAEEEKKKPLPQRQNELLGKTLLETTSGRSFTGRELLQIIGEIEAKNTATVTGKWKKYKRLLPGHHISVYSKQLMTELEAFGVKPGTLIPAMRELANVKLIHMENISLESGVGMLLRWTNSTYSFKLKSDAKKLLQPEA